MEPPIYLHLNLPQRSIADPLSLLSLELDQEEAQEGGADSGDPPPELSRETTLSWYRLPNPVTPFFPNLVRRIVSYLQTGPAVRTPSTLSARTPPALWLRALDIYFSGSRIANLHDTASTDRRTLCLKTSSFLCRDFFIFTHHADRNGAIGQLICPSIWISHPHVVFA